MTPTDYATDIRDKLAPLSLRDVDRTALEQSLLAVFIFAGLTLDDLQSQRRTRLLVDHRAALCCVLRQRTDMTYEQIADLLHRDHTTVIHHAQNSARSVTTVMLLAALGSVTA